MRRVVITGMGCVTPIGNNVNESWKSILENKCGIAPITRFDTTDFKVKLAGEVKNLDFNDYRFLTSIFPFIFSNSTRFFSSSASSFISRISPNLSDAIRAS